MTAAMAGPIRRPSTERGASQAERRPNLSNADKRALYERLKRAHPDAHCELVHADPFQLLVATVLSAQSTDVAVNQVTPGLFEAFGTPRALGSADVHEVERLIGRLGMFRQKAKHIVGLARAIESEHGGRVPADLDALVRLPGVGRKTANVVLGVAFGSPEGVVVDTHVLRIAQRLGWTKNTTPEKVEADLCALLPRSEWEHVSHVLIFHGRRVCTARAPKCKECAVNDACPNAFDAERVGRKAPSPRKRAASAKRATMAKRSKTGGTESRAKPKKSAFGRRRG